MKALALGVAAVVATLTTSVQAETQRSFCGNRDTIHDRLAQKYRELPVVRALSGSGNLVEMLASPEGTWTMIVTAPGGQACIVSTGDMWQPLAAALSAPEA